MSHTYSITRRAAQSRIYTYFKFFFKIVVEIGPCGPIYLMLHFPTGKYLPLVGPSALEEGLFSPSVIPHQILYSKVVEMEIRIILLSYNDNTL